MPNIPPTDYDAKIDSILESFVLELDSFRKENPTKPVDAIYAQARHALQQLLLEARQEAEDAVIAIAHRKPCDCGSNDHFPTPVRSVMGNVTYYCQFSRIVPSSAQLREGGE
jgi:hypothetical protein